MPDRRQSEDSMRWVRQEDPSGCGVAVLAMLTGLTYAEVIAEIEAEPWYKLSAAAFREGHSTNGVVLERYLTDRGWWHSCRYETWCSEWPPKPFAPFHTVHVNQPSGNDHYLAMDGRGRVLDPLREGVFGLADWPSVGNVVGWRV
jgi:hypothetical protein